MADSTITARVRDVFIIGAKSIGQYGGYETFVDRLIELHREEGLIKYHVACKANGEGCMDESRLSGVKILKENSDGTAAEFEYCGAHVFKIKCPNVGPAAAIYYDRAALDYSIRYCREHNIRKPVFYVLSCRIGTFIKGLAKQIMELDGKLFINPDGHEWKRAKWSAPVRRYWKWSERKMIGYADLVICDSVIIENYIRNEYGCTNTAYIAYGADTDRSTLADDAPEFTGWLDEHGLEAGGYYLVVGRLVPENNYETMIREFMASGSEKRLALITNTNDKYIRELEERLRFSRDGRIKFVGTVYDKELLKKIRERACGYLHGHEVGGTNPSLLEAMGSTGLNLVLDVGFNREVAGDAALYWSKESGDLARLIDRADVMDKDRVDALGAAAKDRVKNAYRWQFIGDEYKRVFVEAFRNDDLITQGNE